MGLKSTLKRLAKAAPVVIAAAPVAIDAVRAVRNAAKKKRKDRPRVAEGDVMRR